MKKTTRVSLGVLAVMMVLTLSACGAKGASSSDSKNDDSKKESTFSSALVTDIGGVDDKSFNQSAWEGMQAWGEENGLEKGVGGYDYFQSGNESEFITNIDQAVQANFDVIYGIGFALREAILSEAEQNPDTNFVIVDDVIEDLDNVASAVFADNESSYLAGVAAGKTTKTQKIGFIGGTEGAVIGRFQAGFEAGIAAVNPSAVVVVEYAGTYGDPAKGKTIASAMYAGGCDIIFQVAGGTGAGAFSEAIAINQGKASDAADKVWIIGVDRDQIEEGAYKANDGKESNLTLCSTTKGVGATVIAINKLAQDGNFPGGKVETYGIKAGGVDLANDNLSDDVISEVDNAREEIIDGEIKVPTGLAE
ncbi:MAG: BMP family protein [Clostridiales Family XIII bacterium]|jgi:basic membrane protein A|nr:BMP family protein [Clostridiales Family XIII bacterium]